MAEDPVVDWRDGLSADLRSEPFVNEATDRDSFVKQAVDAHKAFGSRVPLPKADATPEQIAEYVNKATAEPYELKWGDGITWNDGAQGKWQESFKKHGLMPFQAQGLLDDVAEDIKANQGVTDKQVEDLKLNNLTELKKRFGDDIESVKNKAKKAMTHIGREDGVGEKVAGLLFEAGLHENPDVLSLFQKVGDSISEDSWMQGEVRTIMTPQDAQRKLDVMLKDKAHPANNSGDRNFKAANEERERLAIIAAGGSTS